jgi:hypothetical protein
MTATAARTYEAPESEQDAMRFVGCVAEQVKRRLGDGVRP